MKNLSLLLFLFHHLIFLGHCTSRLCQDIVLFKAEVAELLLPSIFVNIAARKDLEIDLHRLISLQVVF